MPSAAAKSQVIADPELLPPLALREREVRRVSGLSRTTLLRMRKRGQIVTRKAGKILLYDYQSLKNALEALPEG
jgi:hypothetical protein